MTAMVDHRWYSGRSPLLMWRGAMQVAEGALSGGTIAAFVFTGVLVAGVVRLADRSLSAICCAGRVRPAGSTNCCDEKPDIAPPARAAGAAQPAARQPVVPECHLQLSHAAQRTGDLRFHADGRAGRNRGHRRPVGRGQVDDLPAGRTVLRSASGHRSAWTACR